MTALEIWLLIMTSVVSLQLVVILLVFWRAKRTAIFIGTQFELLFWISVTIGIATTGCVFLGNVPITTAILYCCVRSFTLAAIFMGNPAHGKERWSYLFETDDKNKGN